MVKFTLTAEQARVLVAMHTGDRPSYDMFSFGAGFNPETLSTLHRAGVIAGNHRNGFNLTVPGSRIAAKAARQMPRAFKPGTKVVAQWEGQEWAGVVLAWAKPHPLANEARRVRFSHGGVAIVLVEHMRPA